MSDDLEALCRAHGIVAPPGPDGQWTQTLSSETMRAVLEAIGVDAGDDDALTAGSALPPLRLAAPEGTNCFLPRWLGRERAWGVAVQLYELRSRRNWGIGDFADLAALAPLLAGAGADFIGLNPLHALFCADPARASPFSPSNRRFWNPLYIAVDRVPGYEPGKTPTGLDDLRGKDRVDYARVARVKLAALRALWDKADAEVDFQAYLDAGGEALHLHGLFEALSQAMAEEGYGAGWRTWPDPYRDRRSTAVAAFARDHADDVRFHQWLQYLCDRQIGEAQAACRQAGMRIGLYLDLAIGEAPDGSATWSARKDYVTRATVGAPPDFFTAEGQSWGLAAISPLRVRGTKAAILAPVYEAAMRHAGAIRLDHVMGIWQLFLIPEGMEAADGAYARLPAQEVLALLAELSQRHATILVGEDLGIVPDGFREVLAAANLLSYRVLYFEQGEDGFSDAASYPNLALACVATHDLPTLRGWWKGTDIDLREEFGLIGSEAAKAQRRHRENERQALLDALDIAGGAGLADPPGEIPQQVVVEAHRFIAATPSVLTVARYADLAGEEAPTNVPGTSGEYPNWQIKSAVAIEEIGESELFAKITRAMDAARGSAR